MLHFGAKKAGLMKLLLSDCKKSSVIENPCSDSLNAPFKRQNGEFKVITKLEFAIDSNEISVLRWSDPKRSQAQRIQANCWNSLLT
jgi:hypothetical protein